VFEDEFESDLPQENYKNVIPLGYDILKTIVIPAFEKVRSKTSQDQGRDALINIIKSMNLLAIKSPLIAEQACRTMFEDLFAYIKTDKIYQTIAKRVSRVCERITVSY
jgi:hypothetical protein